MPLPVIVGIPWLAGLLGGLFTTLIAWFAQFFTKRLAIVAAVVSGIALLTSAFFGLIESLISALLLTAPSELTLAVQLVIPSNFTLCITTIVTAKIARWAYDWNVKIVQLKLF